MEWISVKDSLPEQASVDKCTVSDDVLVTVEDEAGCVRITIGFWQNLQIKGGINMSAYYNPDTRTVRIRVDGEPVAQGRPRFARRGGFVQAYDPKKIQRL